MFKRSMNSRAFTGASIALYRTLPTIAGRPKLFHLVALFVLPRRQRKCSVMKTGGFFSVCSGAIRWGLLREVQLTRSASYARRYDKKLHKNGESIRESSTAKAATEARERAPDLAPRSTAAAYRERNHKNNQPEYYHNNANYTWHNSKSSHKTLRGDAAYTFSGRLIHPRLLFVPVPLPRKRKKDARGKINKKGDQKFANASVRAVGADDTRAVATAVGGRLARRAVEMEQPSVITAVIRCGDSTRGRSAQLPLRPMAGGHVTPRARTRLFTNNNSRDGGAASTARRLRATRYAQLSMHLAGFGALARASICLLRSLFSSIDALPAIWARIGITTTLAMICFNSKAQDNA
ncbi:unnamed protein product, partial [Iphiclides podalirius]